MNNLLSLIFSVHKNAHLFHVVFVEGQKTCGGLVSLADEFPGFLINHLSRVLAVRLVHHQLPGAWYVKRHIANALVHAQLGDLWATKHDHVL